MAKIKRAGSCSEYQKAKGKQGGTEASLIYFRSLAAPGNGPLGSQPLL